MSRGFRYKTKEEKDEWLSYNLSQKITAVEKLTMERDRTLYENKQSFNLSVIKYCLGLGIIVVVTTLILFL